MKYVISLGGSIINPGIINVGLLQELKKFLTKSRHDFVIVCGGGKIARDYIRAGKELKAPSLRLDELGIKATELNAELVSVALGVRRAKNIDEVLKGGRIVVTNGLFPGVTSDFDSVVIADLIGAEAVINLSNVKGIYDKDPKKNKDARLLKTLTYNDLLTLASEYELGLGANFIFDLAATKLAQRAGTKLIFTQGINNLKAVIKKKRFTGSVVQK